MFMRQFSIALRILAILVAALGLIYPSALWAAGRFSAFTADGSLVTDAQHRTIGSALIGQSFPGPQWFHPRPSAAGAGYDPMNSGASNLAQSSPTLIREVTARTSLVARADGVAPAAIPADAVTASASGLDPDISPDYARLQVQRIARARSVDPALVARLVARLTQGRTLGIFGEPRVNVLSLNLALQQLS